MNLKDLQEFVNEFIDCGLRLSYEDESAEVELSRNYDRSKVEQKTLEDITYTCTEFVSNCWYDLVVAIDRGYTVSQAAYDFWLTTRGHGAGFWDRGILKEGGIGERLTELSKHYRGENFYLGDDGKIYLG